MSAGRRAWQVAAWFCWVVLLLIVVRPVKVDAETGSTVECGRMFREALADEDTVCSADARGRVDTLVLWAVLTAPVTLGYLTSRTPRAPRTEG